MTSELRPPSELHQPSPQKTTLYLSTYLPIYLSIYLHSRRRRHAYRMAIPPQSEP